MSLLNEPPDERPRRPVSAIVEAVLRGPAGHRLLLFDFDGTLREFTSAPGEADLPGARRSLLLALEQRHDATIGIVSGRRVDDVRARAGIDGIIYSGLHGLEIQGPGLSFVHPAVADARELVPGLARELADSVRGLPGVVVEDKELSLVLHWRRAAPAEQAAAEEALARVVGGPRLQGRLRVQRGAGMCEVLPNVTWNKGDAVRWIRDAVARQHRVGVWPLFVGDDYTDEDAFAAIGDDGVTVNVGPRTSAATFRLAGPPEVEDLLRALVAAPAWSS